VRWQPARIVRHCCTRKACLLRVLGREKDAQSSFADALGANPPPMIGYLALVALRAAVGVRGYNTVTGSCEKNQESATG